MASFFIIKIHQIQTRHNGINAYMLLLLATYILLIYY